MRTGQTAVSQKALTAGGRRLGFRATEGPIFRQTELRSQRRSGSRRPAVAPFGRCAVRPLRRSAAAQFGRSASSLSLYA
jgi:hypothetical protein